MTTTNDLCFVPYDSVVDTAFWHALSKKKLEEFRLEEGPFPVSAEFTNGTPAGITPRINVDLASLNGYALVLYTHLLLINNKFTCGSFVCRVNSIGRSNLFRVDGHIYTINTIDKFRVMDKQAHIDEFGRKYICSSAINEAKDFMRAPNKLLAFSLLTYCVSPSCFFFLVNVL